MRNVVSESLVPSAASLGHRSSGVMAVCPLSSLPVVAYAVCAFVSLNCGPSPGAGWSQKTQATLLVKRDVLAQLVSCAVQHREVSCLIPQAQFISLMCLI